MHLPRATFANVLSCLALFVALGGAMVVHWVVTEVKRVNEELDARRARVRIRDRRPTLRRDPLSGEFRL